METRLLYLKESVYMTFIFSPVAGGFSPGFNYIAWSTSALVPFHKYCSRADPFLTPAWLQSGQKCAITVDELSWKRCRYSIDATLREVGVEKEPLFSPPFARLVIYHSISPLGRRLKGKGKGIPGQRDRAPKFRSPSLSTNSVWFDFVGLVAATKFCCRDKDFHKNSPVHTKGLVAATCCHNVLPQLVA